MKKTLYLFLFALVAISSFSYYIYQVPDSIKYEEDGNKRYNAGLRMQQEFDLTRDPQTGTVPSERLIAAEAYRNSLLTNPNFRTSAAVTGINWQERGPSNIGGRTRALLFDKGDAANGYKKVWAGAVGGGLWYTNDITATPVVWNRVNDFLQNLSISSIVQNPSNPLEMYFGTGEGYSDAASYIRGLGIWSTTNGGATWTHLASSAGFTAINDLLVDNSGNLFATVKGLGLQKSTDGGASFTRVLGNPADATKIGADLELAANGDIYVSMGLEPGRVFRSPFAAGNTGNTGTWNEITPNGTGVITPNSTDWKRIELATAPSDANVLYALFEGINSDGVCTSIQQYNMTNNQWSVKTVAKIHDQETSPNTAFTRDQAWYDFIATVDPNNANRLYVAGIDACRSDDGGATWNQVTTWALANTPGFTETVHADHHMMAFAPGNSSRAVLGTDGGIYYTTNADIASPGKPTYTLKNNGYNVTQFYSCAIHPASGSNYFLAGAQDNGTQKFNAAGIATTTEVSGGDGAFCHIDQQDPNVQISAYTNNVYYITTDGGATAFQERSFNSKSGSFINPTDYDNSGKKLYAAHNVDSFLRWNDPATGGASFNLVRVAEFGGAKITHVRVSPTVPNRVYFGLNNGSIVKVDNAQTGSPVTGTIIRTGPGDISVSSIAIDPANENHMLVTYSNYGVVHVFETSNANAATPTWKDVQGNIPDMPVRWAMFDPRNSNWAIIATELGVWSTDNLNDATPSWQPTNGGLANVRVDMLKYRSSDRTILAATHGRGLFTTVIPSVLPVTLLNFDGALENKNIRLSWSTASEQHTRNFEVEKSSNGRAFSAMATVAAAGSSTTRRNYTLLDTKISVDNYYRLRINDLNGQTTVSQVVHIRGNGINQNAWIVSNPFINHIEIRFAKAGKSIKLQLLNASGAMVTEKVLSNLSSQYRWELPANIGKGAYVARIIMDGESYVHKVVKQ